MHIIVLLYIYTHEASYIIATVAAIMKLIFQVEGTAWWHNRKLQCKNPKIQPYTFLQIHFLHIKYSYKLAL